MTSVTIIGLKGVQADKIKSLYGDRLELDFIGSNTPVQQIKATAASSDHVIVMTKFMSHNIHDAMRKHDGLTYCNGGVSAVKLQLDDFLKI